MKRRKGKIDLKTFNKLFYEDKLSNKEVAERLGVGVSAIGAFRGRYNLPARGWSVHPMLGKHHTQDTKNKISKSTMGKRCGDKNNFWKGGQYLSHGYKLILKPHCKSSNSDGYILEHRYIMEKHTKHILNNNEVVHHINGNKLDNRIENLMIYNRSTHAYLHFPKGSHFGIHNRKSRVNEQTSIVPDARCSTCGSPFNC